MSLFITGTDTGVGKTHTAVQILRLLRANGNTCAGFKPICCGDRDDAKRLLEAGSEGFSIDEINRVWLKTPAAPLAASLAENVNIDMLQIARGFEELQKRVDHVIVEGVGGWLVPIRADYCVSDLAAELRLPVLVVVRNKLGCLNHTALTVRSIVTHGLPVAGIVMNETAETVRDDVSVSSNAQMLEAMFPAIPLLNSISSSAQEFSADWRPLFP